MINYKELLLEKNFKIGVWGTGYIGFSSMLFFARKMVKTLGFDTIPDKIARIANEEYFYRELVDWLDFPIKEIIKGEYILGSNNYNELLKEDVIVHLVAIPTEKNGEPYFDILNAVIDNLCEMDREREVKPLIIIESTLSPRTSEKIVLPRFLKNNFKPGVDFLYGVAPRRDWFVAGGKNLADLDRVYGGYDEESSNAIYNVLSIICKKLHGASNYEVSEMVKSFENAYRHMEITLANQLSLAYPNKNIREVLQLVGTKWNIGTFYPGFGTGGYCIPLSSKYVLQGAENPGELGILDSTIETDNKINKLIGESIVKKGFKKIGVLGLSYKGNLKVYILSPTIPFVEELKRSGVEVKVYDPYFSDEEIKNILGTETFSFPEDLNNFDAIVVAVDHSQFDDERIKKSLNSCKYILDNTGIWKKYFKNSNEIEYHLCGDKGWLN